jgi:hypothetical protein
MEQALYPKRKFVERPSQSPSRGLGACLEKVVLTTFELDEKNGSSRTGVFPSLYNPLADRATRGSGYGKWT